ncbi:MAG: hypothetical protein JRI23_03600 [Deltaproteobacteria bacterium]|jgi:hypothetical protein|nr:hypothetical protein [Deltaproteobacteria bacterium]MBW2530601.1 hypothetical protein [Deltaproteobacteria bacterium]
MRTTTTLVLTLAAIIAAAWSGCGGDDVAQGEPVTTTTFTGIGGTGGTGGGAGGGVLGKGVGESCTDTAECRSGLVCEQGACAPGHTTGEGEPCTISPECEIGLYCAGGVCAPAGTGTDGDACGSDADCDSGYRCALVGLSAVCVPEGSVDLGGSCSGSEDCFGGLACIEGACVIVPPGTPPFGPLWEGIDCPDDEWPVRAEFRVPRGTADDGDFYRLPMPNDVRLNAGQIDLSGHPTPGDALLGYDIVDRYLRAIEQHNDGWGVYGVTYFRFSGPVDFDTSQDQVRLVDLTTDSGLGFYYQFATHRNAYQCANRFQVWPLPGRAYRAGHTYAAFLLDGLKADNGSDIERSPDLVAMLSDTAPSDATLAAEWPKYAGLRAYLTAHSIAPSSVLTAAVFTVGQPQDVTERLAAAVGAAAVPAASDWTLCDSSVASPCPDATGERGCAAADSDFDELHALVTLPIFQAGTAPYDTPADGGDISVDAGGDPQVTGTEQVCLSLTVPKGTVPAGGWPTVVYAHGTGGHFRTHVVKGVADDFAVGVNDGSGTVIKAAVLGIDQVAHGPRRNGSTASPQDLFFNFKNPAAARGYPRQGAADQMSLLRFVPAVSFDAGSSPTGSAFALGAPIAFWGHSQGATLGGIGVPYGDWAGVLMTGQGASLRKALVTKRSPVDIAAVVPWVLGDPRSDGTLIDGANHPVLTMLQTWIDPADPVAYARLAVSEPPGSLAPRHLFQPFGVEDTYTPPEVQATYAFGAGLELAAHDSSVTTPFDIGWPPLQTMPTPISGNRVVASTTVTAVVRQYAPASGDDGHFVVYDVANARADAERFLAGVLGGAMPQVGQ